MKLQFGQEKQLDIEDEQEEPDYQFEYGIDKQKRSSLKSLI